jgi:hypothetical protein
MKKDEAPPLTEADVVDLIRKFLPGASAIEDEPKDEPDFIGIGRNGITYVFHAKPLGKELPEEMDFAENLRGVIRESGISQCQLAKRAGVPQPAISNFMSGRDIKLETFNRMAAVMGFELKHKRSKMPKTKPAGTRAAKPND